jgi:MFS family permease
VITPGVITAAFPVGAMIGAILCIWLVRYSPRKVLMGVDIVGSCAMCLAMVGEVNVIILARFLTGISLGINPSIGPTYVI